MIRQLHVILNSALMCTHYGFDYFFFTEGRKGKPAREKMNMQMRILKKMTMETPQMKKKMRFQKLKP